MERVVYDGGGLYCVILVKLEVGFFKFFFWGSFGVEVVKRRFLRDRGGRVK